MKPKTVGRVTNGRFGPENAQELCHGIPAGLQIATSDGNRLVETLSGGDLIATRNGGLQPIEAVEVSRHVTRTIRFAAGSLGPSSPPRELLLPAGQPVLIRGRRAMALFGQIEAMTIAAQLTDGSSVVDIGPQRLDLYRLIFDRPRVFRAGGLELGASHAASLPWRAVA